MIAAAGLAFASLAPPVLAADSGLTSLVTEVMSARLRADAAQRTGPHEAAARSGKLKVIGVVNNVSGFVGPFAATLVFEFNGVGNEYNETRTVPVHFQGKLGRFTAVLPFEWKNVDPAGKILFAAIVTSGNCPTASLVLSTGGSGNFCERISEYVSLNPISMPSQNGLTTTVSVAMVQ